MTVVLVTTAAVAVGTFFLLWLVSLGGRDASIGDLFWGPSFAVVSWVAYLVADHPGNLWTAVGPAVMSSLLPRVSGVTLLERDMVARRPGYAEYAARTSAFSPRAPRS